MKLTKSIILAGTALASLVATTSAFAQSTATQEVENTEVIVKGFSKKGAGPINKETGVKTKSVIGQNYISNQAAGQTIAEALNVIPGVNFTSNDPYGSAGGDLFVRGLDGSRVSLTFDGVQLNDAGNYAIYTNQQLDPELIDSASVITGATDIDSITASATGGTVNYTTRKPKDEFGVMAQLSVGSFDYNREFLLVDTGKIGPFGTKAWFAASNTLADTFTIENPDNAKLKKQQYNFSVYQPVGDAGSFVSLSGNFNKNRNRFIFSQSTTNFTNFGPYYNSAGPANINPSDTGNIRIKSKWVLSDSLTLTVDPSYQYAMANGGGTSTANEVTGKIGSWTNSQFAGVDINGDGDKTDTSVTIYNPNTTKTERLGLQTGLIYKISPSHTIRAAASFDRARTRQTGEGTLVAASGAPLNPFGAKDDTSIALYGKDGAYYERRDRFSKANVDVLSVEYLGHFLDDKLFVSLGLRAQKMERELTQNCYSSTTGTGGSTPFCTTQTPTTTNADGTVTFTGNSGKFIKPYSTTVDFKKTLPSVGLTYKLSESGQLFASYTENLSSPRTDQYYAVILDTAGNVAVARPNPEITSSLEGGYRFNSSKLTGSVSVWTRKYEDRIVSSYDAVSDTYFDRNVGQVDMAGVEGSVAWAPTTKLSLQAGFTYTDSEIKADTPNGEVTVAKGTDQVGDILYIPTAGKKLVEVPDWMGTLGASYDVTNDIHLSLLGKYVGKRYLTDVNDYQADSYMTWNFNARFDLPVLKEGTYLQLNVINLTDEYYYGNLSTATSINDLTTTSGTLIKAKTNVATNSWYNVGAPRTVMLTLRTQF